VLLKAYYKIITKLYPNSVASFLLQEIKQLLNVYPFLSASGINDQIIAAALFFFVLL